MDDIYNVLRCMNDNIYDIVVAVKELKEAVNALATSQVFTSKSIKDLSGCILTMSDGHLNALKGFKRAIDALNKKEA